MPRTQRVDVGTIVYHVINRANARMQIFNTNEDYQLFELNEKASLTPININRYLTRAAPLRPRQDSNLQPCR
jgi:hypothetical protein